MKYVYYEGRVLSENLLPYYEKQPVWFFFVALRVMN